MTFAGWLPLSFEMIETVNMRLNTIKKWLIYYHPEWVYIYHLVRVEILLVILDITAFISLRQRRLIKSLQDQSSLKLHIGCGKNYVDGWLNVDIGPSADIRFNLRSKFPLKAGSTKYIFTEHFLDRFASTRTLTSSSFRMLSCFRKGGNHANNCT